MMVMIITDDEKHYYDNDCYGDYDDNDHDQMSIIMLVLIWIQTADNICKQF